MNHWNRFDCRINSLIYVLSGLEKSISQLVEQCNESQLYAEKFFSEEYEPILGLVFVALQNYVNSSIFDLDETLKGKEKRYKQDKELKDSGRTRIELIIGLANYFKHRDDNRDLNIGTSNILGDLGITYDDSIENYYSPIFVGMELLVREDKISDLIPIVQEWRESLWKIEEIITIYGNTRE